ncbi:MAG: hypothetical protein GXO26_01840 [Crenarchaeota archaeon]|nr:hypothetical protein [Thermoproteota archaeon]
MKRRWNIYLAAIAVLTMLVLISSGTVYTVNIVVLFDNWLLKHYPSVYAGLLLASSTAALYFLYNLLGRNLFNLDLRWAPYLSISLTVQSLLELYPLNYLFASSIYDTVIGVLVLPVVDVLNLLLMFILCLVLQAV